MKKTTPTFAIAVCRSPASMPERLRCSAGGGGVGTMNRGSTLVASDRGGVGNANG